MNNFFGPFGKILKILTSSQWFLSHYIKIKKVKIKIYITEVKKERKSFLNLSCVNIHVYSYYLIWSKRNRWL